MSVPYYFQILLFRYLTPKYNLRVCAAKKESHTAHNKDQATNHLSRKCWEHAPLQSLHT